MEGDLPVVYEYLLHILIYFPVFQHLGALKFAQKLVIPVQGFNSIQDMRAWWHLDSLYLGLLVSNSLDSTYPFTLRIAKAKFNADVDASAIASQILDQIV